MENLKSRGFKYNFFRVLTVVLTVNILLCSSLFLKDNDIVLHLKADEITENNSKSIFVNLAFMVMGTLGINVVASANGLAGDFAGSLGDLFDSWLSYRNLTLSGIASLIGSKTKVANNSGVSTLTLVGSLYNEIVDFLNYCGGAVTSGVTSIFNTDIPAFVYEEPSSYFLLPIGISTRIANNNATTSTAYNINYLITSAANEIRSVFLEYNNLVYYVMGSITTFSGQRQRLRKSNDSVYDTQSFTATLYTAGNVYIFVNSSSVPSMSGSVYTFVSDIPRIVVDSSVNTALAYYYLFGAGAVGGTDGTIGLPDAISRNYNDVNNKPFAGVGENDDVPIAIPGDFALDYPLTGVWDIPDSIPFAIPWVLDIPTALDTPIDIPFYPVPGEVPPAIVPAPDPLVDVPLIVSPECESLSACLIQGVQTVSNQISSFVNINQEFRNYTVITLAIGFAMFVLGVFF